eukprot:6175482-Pleurochrysis_carterae.AAC.2
MRASDTPRHGTAPHRSSTRTHKSSSTRMRMAAFDASLTRYEEAHIRRRRETPARVNAAMLACTVPKCPAHERQLLRARVCTRARMHSKPCACLRDARSTGLIRTHSLWLSARSL